MQATLSDTTSIEFDAVFPPKVETAARGVRDIAPDEWDSDRPWETASWPALESEPVGSASQSFFVAWPLALDQVTLPDLVGRLSVEQYSRAPVSDFYQLLTLLAQQRDRTDNVIPVTSADAERIGPLTE